MSLEKIISQGKKFVKNSIITATALAAIASFSGCGKSINPLGAKIPAQVTRSADYNFSGDTIEATIMPSEKPYQYIEVAVKKPGDADFGAYEKLSGFTKSIATTTYGNYDFKFKIISDQNETASENTVEIPVYMNEAQSDAALEQAIQEIGVNASTATKGEIKGYEMNGTTGSYEFDADDVEIRCRGPPAYAGFYWFDIQGSKTDTLNQAKKNYINGGLGGGYLFIAPVMSKDEIKNRILQEKNANWPDITGY